MEARVHRTLVNVLFAVVTGVAGVGTVTRVQIDAVNTRATVETRLWLTVVNIDLTVPAAVAGRADTRVVVDAIFTLGSILTRSRLALVNIQLTNFP